VLSRELVAEAVARVERRVLERARASGTRLDQLVLETIYAERLRLSQAPRAPRHARDAAFIAALRRDLLRGGEGGSRELVARVVRRYAQEVAGDFDARIYRMATTLVPAALGRISGERSAAQPLAARMHLSGEIESLCALAARGTILLAPTHVSNVDSLVLGLVIHRLGLPPFAYGAGLNLYANALMGFFMSHLGAYTIDRQKTDPLYRETLKEFVMVLLERGQHNLIFPGGTRSRSGAIERRLKKGLLGTAPSAYRHALESGAARPGIFVVPCTLSYPFVLEAATLIGDFLRSEGGPQYLETRDEFDSSRRWLDFLRGVARLDHGVHIRFSQPLDWMGNELDCEGGSRDPRSHHVAPDAYLRVAGRLVADAARDAEYTRQLAARVVEAYRRDHVALPTQLVAFVMFERFRRGRVGSELLRSLRGPCVEGDVGEVLLDLARAQAELEQLERRGKIRSAASLTQTAPARLLNEALEALASYHGRSVVERAGERLCVRDPELLFYYRNRLEGYGLLGAGDLLSTLHARSRRPWP
jgi:glycerol-3-phosphate O-acyltransferase